MSANVRNCPTEIEKEKEIEEEYIRTESDSEQKQNIQEQYAQDQNEQELVQGHIGAETETYEQYEKRIICVLEEEQYAAGQDQGRAHV